MTQQVRPVPRPRDSGVRRIEPVARRVAGVRILFAHDRASGTCEPLGRELQVALGRAFGACDVLSASSLGSAKLALEDVVPDVSFVSLDLPPAPVAGARLAEALVKAGRPVVIVTRSLRWLPPNVPELRALPWVTPDADAASLVEAAREALGARALSAVAT